MTAVDALLTLLALASLIVTAVLGAALTRPRGVVSFLLLAYALAWLEVIAVALILSPAELLTRGWIVGAYIACVVVVGAVWTARGRPRPPHRSGAVGELVAALRDPAVGILAALVAAGWLYTVALAFFTAPLEWDSLSYHLPRAALWVQQHAVGYIPDANDPRLDGNPPGAEIGLATTMAITRGDRLVALPQLFALGALFVAVFGCSRRLGLSVRAALFGALLFASLPLVAIQAPTTYNDLVVGSFLVVTGYGLLGASRHDLALVALGLGLGLTTKFTAILALPILALVAATATPIKRWPRVIGAGAAGIVLGSSWYIVNLVKTGHADGALTSATAQTQDLSLLAIAPTLRRHVYAFVDFSGSRGVDIFLLFGLLALVVAGVGVAVAVVRRDRRPAATAVIAAALVLLPLLLVVIGRAGIRGWYKGWLVLGRRDIAVADDSWQLQKSSDAALSWFGPVVAVLLLVGTFFVLRAVVRGSLPRVAAVLVTAPLTFIVVFAILVPWDPWRGRFVVFAIAFAAATWGALVAIRPVVWATVALALVIFPFALLGMYTKPAGVPVLEGTDGRPPSVWTTSRLDVLEYLNQRHDVIGAIRAVEARGSTTVAAAVRENDWLYPFFGRRLERTIVLVPQDGGRVPAEAQVVVAAPGSRVELCGRWQQQYTNRGWVVLERRGAATASPCRTLRTAAHPL